MKQELFESIFKEDVASDSRMTVGELIEALSKYSKDEPVRAICFHHESLTGGCDAYGWVESVDKDYNGVCIEAYK